MTFATEKAPSASFSEVAGYACPRDLSHAIQSMRPSEALEILERGIRGWGVEGAVVLCNQRAGILSRTGRLDDAIAYQEFIQHQVPENHRGACQLVHFYLKAADSARQGGQNYGFWRVKAMNLAEQLVRDYPRVENCWNTLITAYRRSNKPEQAIAAARTALGQEKFRNNPVLKSGLIAAYLHANRNQDAVIFAEQALAQHPEDKAINTLYANALSQSGQPQRAMELLDKMITADPKDPHLKKARVRAETAMNARSLGLSL